MAPRVTRLSGEARNKIVAATSSTLGHSRVIGFRHGLTIGRRVHDRGRHRVDQNAVLGDFFGERRGQGCDRRLARGIGDHSGAAAPFQAGAGRDVDDAAAARHRRHRGAAAQHAAYEDSCRSAAGSSPRRHRATARRQSRRRCGSMPTAARCRRKAVTAASSARLPVTTERHLLMIAKAEAFRFRFVETRHVTQRAGLDQRGDNGGAERSGAAGDDNVTIAKVHAPKSPPASSPFSRHEARPG